MSPELSLHATSSFCLLVPLEPHLSSYQRSRLTLHQTLVNDHVSSASFLHFVFLGSEENAHMAAFLAVQFLLCYAPSDLYSCEDFCGHSTTCQAVMFPY